MTTSPPRSMRSSVSGSAPEPTETITPSSTSIQPASCSVPTSSHVTIQHPENRALHTASGTISNRSPSTSPRSVILRCGMTERPRNESVRNGVAPLQPSPRAASLHARLCAITSASGAADRSPAIGSGHSASMRPILDRDDPAPDLGEPLDGERHVRVRHSDDDEVVGVVRDGRCESASRRAPIRRRSRGRYVLSRGAARRPRSSRDRELRPRPRSRRRRRARRRPSSSPPDPGISPMCPDRLARAPGSRSRPQRRDVCARSVEPSRGSRSAVLSPIGRPLFSTVSGANVTRSGRRSRSA